MSDIYIASGSSGPGSGAVFTITGNSGGPESPDSGGNFNILGTGSITTVGSTNTETIELTGLTNHTVLVGAGTATITKVGPGSAGQVLQSGGASGDPVYSTATYPGTAGSSGNIITSDGTNWTSSAPATSGTVTSVSVVSANGFAGTVATATTTPAITLSTSQTGLLSGNGTAITGTGITQYNVLTAGASNAPNSVAPSATSGVPLISQGSSSQPAFGTAVVAGGGTGDTSFTAYMPLCGGTTTTGALQSVSTGAASAGYVLTYVSSSALPTWQSAGGGGGITTIDGNSGNITGTTVTIHASTSDGTALFTNSGTTSTLTFTNGSNSIAIGGNSSVNTGSQCTIIGLNAGRGGGMTGFGNSGLGTTVLYSLTSGQYNCALGPNAVSDMQSGSGNIGIGYEACAGTTGNNNVCVGHQAGVSYNGAEDSNICIGSTTGVNGESHALHIGNGTGTSSGNLNSAFISGIQTIVVTGTPVLVSTGDQLGVAASSQKFKQNIVNMADTSDVISKLRPVNFNWDKSSSIGLKDATDDAQYGLIAEEVHEVMPYLCVYDKEGKPFSVKYNELPAILLNELQKALKRIEVLESKVA